MAPHSGGRFPLLELVEQLPDVVQDSLLGALQPRHRAALALTCSALRSVVQQTARELRLTTGSCCLVHAHLLHPRMPRISSVVLKPGNLHEAMYVVPLFCMQDACHMPGITSLQMLDFLPDRAPDKVQCASCSAWTSTYDLSSILATAAMAMPHLVQLELSTHYVSDGECAAIALMTGLTRLRLRSTHGTKLGGLAKLRPLRRLRSLELLDSNLRCDAGDVAMLFGRSCLTRLQLGFHPTLVPPLLGGLVEMAREGQHAAGGDGGGGGAVPPGPQLRDLSFVLAPYGQFVRRAQDAFSAACSLTALTRLSVGWLCRREREADAVSSVLAPALQLQLTRLAALRELALGWTAGYEVLGALAALTGLTALQVASLPQQPPPATCRLPGVESLTLHLSVRHIRNVGDLGWGQGTLPLCCASVEALAAFPGLTRLELTGTLNGPALLRLPALAPRVAELLLPERLVRCGWAGLAALRRLTALTSLRVGWRASTHKGPPTIGEEWPIDWVDVEWPSAMAEQQEEAALQAMHGEQAQLPPHDEEAAAAVQADEPGSLSLSALAGRPAAGEGGAAEAADAPAGMGADGTPASSPARAARGACGACGAPAAPGCLCRLARLELVGPVPGAELAHVARLLGLRTLVLRDNPAWSSGLPLEPLACLAAPGRLRRLELFSCGGVSALELERTMRAAAPAGWARCQVAVSGAGRGAADLGFGHQHFGPVLSPHEERGDAEHDAAAAGAAADLEEEEEALFAPAGIGPQLPAWQQHLQQLQQQLLHPLPFMPPAPLGLGEMLGAANANLGAANADLGAQGQLPVQGLQGLLNQVGDMHQQALQLQQQLMDLHHQQADVLAQVQLLQPPPPPPPHLLHEMQALVQHLHQHAPDEGQLPLAEQPGQPGGGQQQ